MNNDSKKNIIILIILCLIILLVPGTLIFIYCGNDAWRLLFSITIVPAMTFVLLPFIAIGSLARAGAPVNLSRVLLKSYHLLKQGICQFIGNKKPGKIE